MGVYKRGRIAWLRYRGPDGQLVRESTRQADSRVAQRLLAERKAAVARGSWKPWITDTADGRPALRPRRPTRVYFLHDPVSATIKIGSATNVRARVATIQACSPVGLTLLCDVPGGIDLERQLHRRFAAERLHGEWFRCTAKLLQVARELTQSKTGGG